MSEIRRLLDDLQDTDAAVSKLDTELESHPSNEILRINAASIRKRRSDLVQRLDQELAVQQHDLILYKIMRGSANYPAQAVAKSILTFQELVTAIFDALRSFPKLRYRPTVENAALSTMDFAAARSGSVAISLYIPSERLLLVESDIDMTFTKVFEMLSSRDEQDFRHLVEIVGVASISKAYSWADVSSTFEMDTAISWGKTFENQKSINISKGEALKIKEAIESTKNEEDQPFQYDCLLEGLDQTTSYFHIVLNDGQDIKGETADDFPRAEWTLNRYYKADLVRKTVVKFATGEEKVFWILRSLIETENRA